VTSAWFPGEGRDPDDEAFLTELRARASTWGLADVSPEDTFVVEDEWGWLVACVSVPGLDAGDARPELQVGFVLARAGVPPLVATWETHGHLLGNWDELDLGTRSPTPAGMADRTFAWLDEQLRRPVELVTWRTWRGRTL
jgi:hypothetical protein